MFLLIQTRYFLTWSLRLDTGALDELFLSLIQTSNFFLNKIVLGTHKTDFVAVKDLGKWVGLPPGWMPYQVLQHPKLWDWWVAHFPMGLVGSALSRGEGAPPTAGCTCSFLPLSSYHIPPMIALFSWAVWYEINPWRQRGGLNLVSHHLCDWYALQGNATLTSNCFNNPLIPQLVLPVPEMKCFAICFAWNYSTKLLPIYEWIWLPQNQSFSKVTLAKPPHPVLFLSVLPNLMYSICV